MGRRAETWTFPSVSQPGVTHTVTLGGHGVLACTCVGWRRRRGQVRECKHVKAVIAVEGFSTVQRGDYVFVVYPPLED